MSKGPYSGLKIVDCTRVLAGPYCTMMLADQGATVVKVEIPGYGDDSRHIGPFIKGKSAYYISVNRGKHSIALDLKAPDDRAVFERLLAEADILIENYRGGTMEKLGYGWPSLHTRYPNLIYCAISGFGHTGPYADRPAYDIVVQGMGGMMSLTGHPGTPPTRVGTSIGDITAGLFAMSAIGAALYHRERTGEAQMIDIAMLDCQVALLENAIARTIATGKPPGPLGSRHPSITPFAAFETGDQHIIIAAGNDQLFAKLCEAIGAPALTRDARYETNDKRNLHHAELAQDLERVLKTKPAAYWITAIELAGVPCGPINNVAQVMADPHIQSRNMIVSVEDPDIGTLQLAGNPMKLSAFPDAKTRSPAQKLDERGHDIRQKGFAAIRS
ncbi:MAG: CoA transferase [Alphaproteobacteria bacterium]|nr:CoA transferase [Alphaproteobacteria bacterium]